MLCSFDIGIKNLSYCILDNKINIIDWNIINLLDKKTYDINEISNNLIKELDKIKDIYKCNSAIIENQPCMKNPKMKTIQIMLYQTLKIKGNNINIHFINANNKIKNVPNIFNENTYLYNYFYRKYKNRDLVIQYINKSLYNKRKGYKISKLISIDYCIYLLKDNKWFNFIKQNKKKDDLSDAYLQAYYCLNS